MKAKEMFEKLGYKKIENPRELTSVYAAYEQDDIVYEYYHEGELCLRLYFNVEYKIYGYELVYDVVIETNIEEHQAITQQLKELEWIE